MKPKFLSIASVLLLAVLLISGCKSSAIRDRDDGPSSEAGAGDVDLEVTTKEQFQTELEEWNRILVMNTNKLQLRLKTAGAAVSDDVQEILDELEEKKKEAQAALNDFRTKSAEEWEELKEELKAKFEAWEDLYEEEKEEYDRA